MWFNNLHLYRVPAPWAITAEDLEAALAARAFTPCESLESSSQGWTAPCAGEKLVYTANRQILLKIKTEKKLLPTSVVNRMAQEKAAEIEQEQGFKPGRKQLREIKEHVTDELLPKAFSLHSFTSIWIDPVNGWLVVDAASAARADDALKLLLLSIDQLPLQGLHTNTSPLTAMTGWLAADEAPDGFSIDQDSELKAPGTGSATVRYVHHTLEADDMRRHIVAGKQCTRLAMTWSARISFVLTESLTIKRIAALDVITEDELAANDQDERFQSDFVLMTGELNRMLSAIVTALGGERTEQADWVQKAGEAPDAKITTALNRLDAPMHLTREPADSYGEVIIMNQNKVQVESQQLRGRRA